MARRGARGLKQTVQRGGVPPQTLRRWEGAYATPDAVSDPPVVAVASRIVIARVLQGDLPRRVQRIAARLGIEYTPAPVAAWVLAEDAAARQLLGRHASVGTPMGPEGYAITTDPDIFIETGLFGFADREVKTRIVPADPDRRGRSVGIQLNATTGPSDTLGQVLEIERGAVRRTGVRDDRIGHFVRLGTATYPNDDGRWEAFHAQCAAQPRSTVVLGRLCVIEYAPQTAGAP